ncbi:hypothetical protein [Natrarchaeobaculum sulfurireducens]|uniref:hypothetical protein n=1 Tax=Natrarchaeobaculum sulfurireducens TaxID=2044521 RepID=UPI00105AB0B8|nr:hypothetical protein [Natrarchaeobaculum sulfurireducens]
MHSRRAVLRMGTVVGLATVAGCAAPRAEPTSRLGDIGVPNPGNPVYRTWLPASADAEDPDDIGSAAIRYVDVDRALERGDTLSAGLAGSLFEFWAFGDWFGHDLADLEGLLVIGGGPLTIAYIGEIDATEAESGLEASEYDPLESDGAADLFVRRDQPRLVGVTASGVVQTELADSSDESIERGRVRIGSLVDAHAGERDRRHESEAAFDRVTERLGRGIRTTVPLEPLEWMPEGSAWGSSLDATDEEAVRRASVTLPDDHAMDGEGDDLEDAFASHLEDAWGDEATVYADSSGLEGVVTVTDEPIGEISTAVPPRTTLAFEYDEDEQTATVTNRAGDALERSQLTITVDGQTGDGLQLEDGSFEPGDRFNVHGLPGDVVVGFEYQLESGAYVTLGQFVGSRELTVDPDDDLEA